MGKKIKQIVSESTFFIFSFYFSRGLRIAFAMAIPLIVGAVFSKMELGVLISSGALIAGLGDNPGAWKTKLYSQCIGAIFYFLVFLISQLLFPYKIVLGIWLSICGFFFSLFFIYGSRAVSVSISALLCIVYAYSFHHYSIFMTLPGVMFGVFFYGIISLALWRIQPYRVSEQKISENIKLLSEYVELLSEYLNLKLLKHPKKDDIEEVLNIIFDKQNKIHTNHEEIRENLFKLRINAKSFSAKGRRMTLVFSAVIDLYEQLISLNLQDDRLIEDLKKGNLKKDFINCLKDIQQILNDLSWAINLNKKVTIDINFTLVDLFRLKVNDLENKENAIEINSLKHLSLLLQSFYKQSKTIKALVNGEANLEKNRYEDLDLTKFTRKYTYDFSTLKANLNLESNIFRHALRVGFAILLSYFVCLIFDIKYFSWVFLTIILTLKPLYGNTKTYSIQRLEGTLIGGGIIILLLFLTQNIYIIAIITLISIVGAYSFIPINYRVGVAFVTIFVILLIFLQHHESDNLTNVYHRLGGTSIAVVFSFLLSIFFLPNWEYRTLPSLVKKLLAYNLEYFNKISYNLLNTDKLSDTDIKLSRKEVLLATSNLSSSFQRVVSEPKLSKEYRSYVYNIQTLINLLSTRISSLRAYNTNEGVTLEEKKIIESIQNLLSESLNCTKENKKSPEELWDENSDRFKAQNSKSSLITYQLIEINILVKQIYKYISKLSDFKEWK